MADKKFNDEWEALPEWYKTRFLKLIEERGLSKDFDELPDEHKSQILEILKEQVLPFVEDPDAPDSDNPPASEPSQD